ncbi:MAG TPA: hypothetical protein EYN66_15330 [Myxococcales bacterium]|nr:hypothetical protein [Myxococcales bacterium]
MPEAKNIKVGDIITLCRRRTANQYGHGGEPVELPVGTLARVLRIEKPFATQDCHYVDVEFLNYQNADGSPVRGGNWHAGAFGEANRHWVELPDSEGKPFYYWRQHHTGTLLPVR